jgi:hypothetical protein
MCLVCYINAEESRSKQEEMKLQELQDLQEQQNASTEEDLDAEFCGDCLPVPGAPLSPQSPQSDIESIEDDIRIDEGGHAVHYFAIGSMTNSTSLSLRELSPIFSRPAVLPGYRLLFRGSGGMATAEREGGGGYELLEGDAEEYPFDCIHGVLHLLTAQHMKVLDDFEGGYCRAAVMVQLYDGTEVRQSKGRLHLSTKECHPTELMS